MSIFPAAQAEAQAAHVAAAARATQAVATAQAAAASTFGAAVARLDGRRAALDAHNVRLLRNLEQQVPVGPSFSGFHVFYLVFLQLYCALCFIPR